MAPRPIRGRSFVKRAGAVRGGDISPRFRSRSEEKTAKLLEEQGVAFGYETRVIEYVRPAQKATYTVDFELPSGVLVEVKGFWDAKDRQKHVLVRRQNPDLDIRILFDRPETPILKNSRTTYAMFCDKQGIPWAKGPSIPEAWLQ